MFKNFFLTAHRNIVRNKMQSAIQVASLSIGIAAAVLIGLYARYELNYDRFNEKFDRIYRVEFGDQVGMPSAIGHQIKQQIPEVENVVRLVNWIGKDEYATWSYYQNNDPSGQERMFRVEDMYYCDSTIFKVFSFSFLHGDPGTALRNPNSVVLTESTARSLFGDEDPMGQVIRRDELTVTGVIEDVINSHIEINMLVSLMSHDSLGGFKRGEQGYLNYYNGDNSFMTYVVLPESNDPRYIEKRVNDYFTETDQDDAFQVSEDTRFSLRPLEDIYFSTNLKGEQNYFRHGNMNLMRTLLAIAISILFISVINYVNISTARASLRAMEVGVRKILGSSKSKLIIQFLTEAILVSIFSFMIALTLVQLLLPGFNQLASTEMDLMISSNPASWLIYIISAIVLGIISGLYPSIYLTGFRTIASLSREQHKGKGSVLFRQVLLTSQFSIAIVLIIGLFVVFRQLHYMKSAHPGFNQELVINNNYYRFGEDQARRRLFRERLLRNPNITGVAFSQGIMGGRQKTGVQPLEANGVKIQCNILPIDADFFEVMEIKLLGGRSFSWDRPADYMNERGNLPAKVIINETAMRAFELESPVGYTETFDNGFTLEIIGLVSDFNFKSLHEKIEPCVYVWFDWLQNASIRITANDVPGTVKFIKTEFQSMFPGGIFDYTFLDETYGEQYIRDEKVAMIISFMTFVAILVACLGLFGLSSFMAARKTKEIGVRKVLGASVQSVFLLLSREFVKWVVLAILIACPVAWIVVNKWLETFAYHTHIEVWVLFAAILIAFLITFLTVTWQSLKTARTNPIESLRYE
ncbi:MAG: hypothetical protein AMS26_09130 [Bacteroides sp. SM23_62]|nr:MAG: hypothetical protein AMS26_09130 [Bacteroides sp. SM23_62]